MLQEEEIEIEYTPIKCVKIIEYTQMSLEELAKRVQAMTQLGRPTVLNWAEGVAFYIIPMPMRDNILVEKYLEGEMVLQRVVYALMPNYRPTIKVKTYDVYVLNQTPSKLLRKVTIWLKKHTKKEEH